MSSPGICDLVEELIVLRISVARLAQAAGVDNELKVTGKPYEMLHKLARENARGWNDLAGRVWEILDDARRQGRNPLD